MTKLTDKVSFDLIRYANCWEDADVLLKGLDPRPGSKLLSIGSAGDNSFSLLVSDPGLVVAIDVNKIQLYLIELKKIAIQELDHKNVLSFLGFLPSENRIETFRSFENMLSRNCRNYWNSHLEEIEKGIIGQGKFEKYFQLFSRKVLPFIHSKKRVAALLSPKSAAEQRSFYDRKWNTWRWRMFFKIFFSRFVMGRLGRDPEFMKEVEVNVGKTIFDKAAAHLKSTNAQSNFILRYNLTGSFGTLLPHYLQPENFEKVKANLSKLHIREGFAESAAEEFGKFDGMNLSNIFEYMDRALFHATASGLISALNPGGRLAYWNLMVPRSVSEAFPDQMSHCPALAASLATEDKGFFYQRFIVDELTA